MFLQKAWDITHELYNITRDYSFGKAKSLQRRVRRKRKGKKTKTEFGGKFSQGQSFRVAIVLKKAPRKGRKGVLLKHDKTVTKGRKGSSGKKRKARMRQKSNRKKAKRSGSKRRIRYSGRKRRGRQSRKREENVEVDENRQTCTGSLIKKKWILTAANCFDVSPLPVLFDTWI